MPKKCKICDKAETKGLFRIQTDWIGVLNLPPDFEIKQHHYVCFRHFLTEDFNFVNGKQLKIKRGNLELL